MSSHSKTIFTTVKNWCWIVLVLLLAGSCLEDSDCLPVGDTALVIQFKRLLDGKADTVVLYTVQAAGADSIFYKSEPDKLDTMANGTVLLAVNPYAEETLFTFNFETETKILRVGYKNEVRLISKECGTDRVQLDLTILETEFDSAHVVNSALTKNRTTNIEIYN